MAEKKTVQYVYQKLEGGVQKEVARRDRGPGRPPQGPTVIEGQDGNLYITNCLTDEPANPSAFNKVEVNGTTVWYPRKSAERFVPHLYTLDEATGVLTDEGEKGQGRPKAGFEKVEDSRVIDGRDLQGHWLKVVTPEAEEAEAEVEATEAD